MLMKFHRYLSGQRTLQVPKDVVFAALAVKLDYVPMVNAHKTTERFERMDFEAGSADQAAGLRLSVVGDVSEALHVRNTAAKVGLLRAEVINVNLVNFGLKLTAQLVAKSKSTAADIQHATAWSQKSGVQRVLVDGFQH